MLLSISFSMTWPLGLAGVILLIPWLPPFLLRSRRLLPAHELVSYSCKNIANYYGPVPYCGVFCPLVCIFSLGSPLVI